jgi:hypothetical protein
MIFVPKLENLLFMSSIMKGFVSPCLPRGIHLGSSWGEPRWMSGGRRVGIKQEKIDRERGYAKWDTVL